MLAIFTFDGRKSGLLLIEIRISGIKDASRPLKYNRGHLGLRVYF